MYLKSLPDHFDFSIPGSICKDQLLRILDRPLGTENTIKGKGEWEVSGEWEDGTRRREERGVEDLRQPHARLNPPSRRASINNLMTQLVQIQSEGSWMKEMLCAGSLNKAMRLLVGCTLTGDSMSKFSC